MEVVLADGSRDIATFFPYQNLESLRSKNAATGECLAGKYFWASNMVLIDRMARASIVQVINTLLQDGSFDNVFSKAS